MSKEYNSDAISFNEWADLLKTRKCPKCGGKADFSPINPTQDQRNVWHCTNCQALFEPKVEEPTKKEKQKKTIRSMEEKFKRSGGSLFPPLPLFFYCHGCFELDMKKLAMKNEREVKNGLKLSEPDGNEGYVAIHVPNQTLTPIHPLIDDGEGKYPSTDIPFNCKCGSRYSLSINMNKRKRKDHPKFLIELGYHNDCFGCPYSWNISIGQKDMSFRCDLNLNCNVIKDRKHRFSFDDNSEDDNNVE